MFALGSGVGAFFYGRALVNETFVASFSAAVATILVNYLLLTVWFRKYD